MVLHIIKKLQKVFEGKGVAHHCNKRRGVPQDNQSMRSSCSCIVQFAVTSEPWHTCDNTRVA